MEKFDTQKLKLSIIMPVYNEAAYLEQTFETILSQTYKNVEVLASDNASDDDTHNVLLRYQSRYPRVFKINRFEQKVHPFKNLLKCTEMASGDYILHFGGDDYPKTKDFIEEAITPFLQEKTVSAHFIRLQYINAFTNENVCLNPPEYVEDFLHLSTVDFVKAFVLETSRDDLFVAVFPREQFWLITHRTYRFAVESPGWWVVLQFLIWAKENNQRVLFDKDAKCIVMKRVQKKPAGQAQSAAGADAIHFDKPWFRIWMSFRYSIQSAKIASKLSLRIRLLFILLFSSKSKNRQKRKYLPIGIAIPLGAFLWAPIYIRLRDGNFFQVLRSGIGKKLAPRFLSSR